MQPDKKANFFQDVYEVVRLIPAGRATSYGAIAQYLGTKGSARMVGWALNGNLGERNLPAHRVVNRNGQLSGKHHFGQPNLMQELLEKEGILVEDDRIIDFGKIFWDPSKELL